MASCCHPPEGCASCLQVERQAAGEVPLPWEDIEAPAAWHAMRSLRAVVLQMLSRDPARRPPLETFQDACAAATAAATGGPA